MQPPPAPPRDVFGWLVDPTWGESIPTGVYVVDFAARRDPQATTRGWLELATLLGGVASAGERAARVADILGRFALPDVGLDKLGALDTTTLALAEAAALSSAPTTVVMPPPPLPLEARTMVRRLAVDRLFEAAPLLVVGSDAIELLEVLAPSRLVFDPFGSRGPRESSSSPSLARSSNPRIFVRVHGTSEAHQAFLSEVRAHGLADQLARPGPAFGPTAYLFERTPSPEQPDEPLPLHVGDIVEKADASGLAVLEVQLFEGKASAPGSQASGPVG